MALAFRCSQCGQTYTKGDEWAGKIISCEGCGKGIRIPAARVGAPSAEPKPANRASIPDRGNPRADLMPPAAATSGMRRGRPVDAESDDDGDGNSEGAKKPSLLRTIAGEACVTVAARGDGSGNLSNLGMNIAHQR